MTTNSEAYTEDSPKFETQIFILGEDYPKEGIIGLNGTSNFILLNR